MIIGVPKEVKNHEYRVGLTPAAARELTGRGHSVLVQAGAGVGIGAEDGDYRTAGATILPGAEEIFSQAGMIVKVKEPQPAERRLLRAGQVLFTYLHLAPDADQTRDLVDSGAVCIAYETVTGPNGALPLLAPMSEVAGRLAVQAGATALERARGGRGVLLAGIPGVAPAKVVILGGGVVGSNAAAIAIGMGADVTVFDRSLDVLRRLDARFGARLKTLYSTSHTLVSEVQAADMVIGGVLVPGATAPKIVSRAMLAGMKRGAVLVDVAIDQGGCFESSHPTTHSEPTYVEQGIVHYCVANMPGAVARTSTYALNNATLPYVLALADKGWQRALRDDPHLLNGLNVLAGRVCCPAVAEQHGYAHLPSDEALQTAN
jgi:alanine dehydrogenase